ncbi:MAG TPA: HXXEE domain-containing protein [Candidatus Saccharimonadales bacterium]|nr:HXXEE domain-containing protein [Candidatus Saccharimonadales bacterium]
MKDQSNHLRIFWLPLILLIIHSIDEVVTGFPNWATEYFGTTTLPFFIYTHIPVLVLVFLSSFFAARNKGGEFWRILATAWAVQFVANGLFHIGTSIISKEFTPGILTAVLLLLPLSFLFIRRVLSSKLLSKKQFYLSSAIGIVLYTLAAISLSFEGSIDWMLKT